MLNYSCYKQSMAAHIGEVIIDNPLQGHRREHRGRVHHWGFAFDALKELVEYDGFRVEKIKTVDCYLLSRTPVWLPCAIDRNHGPYLLIKARNPKDE